MKIDEMEKSTDNSAEDLEATDNEFKGVCYTGISFIAFLLLLIGSLVFMLS